MTTKDNKVTVYAIGGCGINIATPLMRVAAKDTKGYANMTFGMVDTSHSNLPESGFESSFIHVGNRHERTDGNGKIRGNNLNVARQAVPIILARWEPGDLSIVLHSGSGGSGSLLGNLLVRELVSQGKNVVVLMVASRTSVKEMDNVRDTVQSYQKAAVDFGRPVPCYYLDNGNGGLRRVDDQARVMILLLSTIWSGENHGLDRMDLENFLNYQKVSGYKPAVTAIEISIGPDPIPEISTNPVSTVVSIVKAGEDHSPGIMVPYHSYGELSDSALERLKIATPIHVYTRQGVFPEILAELDAMAAPHRNAFDVAEVVINTDLADDDIVV